MGLFRTLHLGIESLNEQEWDDVVVSAWRYDFYHLSSYHRLAHRRGEGDPVLALYQEGDYWIALPLLLRPVSEVPGLEGFPYRDATSVYGYAGPLSSSPNIPSEVQRRFALALEDYLMGEGVVALFSRLHPLIPQQPLIGDMGRVFRAGTTVSIDLTLPPEEQWVRFRATHRNLIRRLRRAGFQCVKDADLEHLAEFAEMYRENMHRIGAADCYHFEHDYFRSFLDMKGAGAALFVCHLDGQPACGGLFTLCGGIMQYHLSATREEFLRLSPVRLLLDEVRLWGQRQGAWAFHLGGGVGGREDSLFTFKAGFSDRRHEFLLWQWVLDRQAYQELCEAKTARDRERGLEARAPGYFPAYRAPTAQPCQREQSQ